MNTRAKSDGPAPVRHAVVLGGSLAGLLAARVLADARSKPAKKQVLSHAD